MTTPKRKPAADEFESVVMCAHCTTDNEYSEETGTPLREDCKRCCGTGFIASPPTSLRPLADLADGILSRLDNGIEVSGDVCGLKFQFTIKSKPK